MLIVLLFLFLTRARLDQIEVGIQGFTGLLQQELENPEPEEAPEEGEVV